MSFIKKYAWYGSAVVASLAFAIALLLSGPATSAEATELGTPALQQEQMLLAASVGDPAHIPRFATENIAFTVTDEVAQTTNAALSIPKQMLLIALMVAAIATVPALLLAVTLLSRVEFTRALNTAFRVSTRLPRRIIAFGGAPGISGRTKPIGSP